MTLSRMPLFKREPGAGSPSLQVFIETLRETGNPRLAAEKAGYSGEEARLLVYTLASHGLVRVESLSRQGCNACSRCPLRRICGRRALA